MSLRGRDEILGLFVTSDAVTALDHIRLSTWSLSDQAEEVQPIAYSRFDALIVTGKIDRTAATSDAALILLNSIDQISLVDYCMKTQ